MLMIGSWGLAKFINWNSKEDDDSFVMQHVYTDDESDISFREKTNKTDGAVRRKLIISYAEKIRQMRAAKAREA